MRTGVNIDTVWARIEANAGQVFRQKRGQPFRYEVRGGGLKPSTVNRVISRRQFAAALELVPLENTSVVQHLQGPSYLYAVLMDDRIRVGQW